ncbi:MAG: hypothetical protein WCC11_02255 [Gammaproteobacteria bacterium]
MKTVIKILWGIAVIFMLFGVVLMIPVYTSAQSVMQQLAGLALGMAYSVIPYCIVRALSSIVQQQKHT